MRAVAVSGDCAVDEALATARSLGEMRGRALVAAVSTKEPYIFSDAGTTRVAVVDYGCKRSILRRLARAGAAVTVYPHDVDADELAAYDGVAALERPRRPGAARGRDRRRARARRARAGARDLPRPPAARPGDRLRDVEAPVRPPRRESSRARARERARARDRAEPRLLRRRGRVGGGHARLALRRHRRRTRLSRSCARARCSSIPRRGLGRTTRGRCSKGG